MPVVSQSRLGVSPHIVEATEVQQTMGDDSNRPPEAVPSLSARSRQTGLSSLVTSRTRSSLPSRERVSAAIALVRARQAATASMQAGKSSNNINIPSKIYNNSGTKNSVERNSDDHSLASTLTSCTASSRIPTASKYKFKLAVSGGLNVPTAASARSPLAPKMQSSSSQSDTPGDVAMNGSTGKNSKLSRVVAEKKQEQSSQGGGSFIQTVFASRSEVASQSATTLPNLPSLGDEQENEPDSGSYTPINTRNSNTSFSEANDSMPAAPSLSMDSDDGSSALDVDRDTLQNVSQFLDKLQKGNDSQLKPVHETPALLSYTSDSDDDDGDDDEADTNDVNPQTLEQIGAFIDAVAKPPAANVADIGNYGIQKTDSDASEDDSLGATDVPAETQKGILAFIESLEKKNSMTQNLESQSSTESKISDTPDPRPKEEQPATAVKERPIYELLDPSVTLGPQDPPEFNPLEEGKEDPPAPPAANLPEAMLRMRQEAEVAPSYSAESLESASEAIISCEEKKDENGDDAVVIEDCASDTIEVIDLAVSSSKSSDEIHMEPILDNPTESFEEETDYTAFEEDEDPPSRRFFPSTSEAEDYEQVFNSSMPLAPVPECKTDLENDAQPIEGNLFSVDIAEQLDLVNQSMDSVNIPEDSTFDLINLSSGSGIPSVTFERGSTEVYDVTDFPSIGLGDSDDQRETKLSDTFDCDNQASRSSEEEVVFTASVDDSCPEPTSLAEGGSVELTDTNSSEDVMSNFLEPNNGASLDEDGRVADEETPEIAAEEEQGGTKQSKDSEEPCRFNDDDYSEVASTSKGEEEVETIEVGDNGSLDASNSGSTSFENERNTIGHDSKGTTQDVIVLTDEVDGGGSSESDDEIVDDKLLIYAWAKGSTSVEQVKEGVENTSGQELDIDLIAPRGAEEVAAGTPWIDSDKIDDILVKYDIGKEEKMVDIFDEDGNVFLDQFASLSIPLEDEDKEGNTVQNHPPATSSTNPSTAPSLPAKDLTLESLPATSSTTFSPKMASRSPAEEPRSPKSPRVEEPRSPKSPKAEVPRSLTSPKSEPRSPKSPRSRDPRSPRSVSKFLAGLKPAEGASEEQIAALDRLKKLIANVVQGEKPSILEAAQIRQAAQRAKISLVLVDKFLEYAEGQQPSMLEVPTKSSEEWSGDSKFDDIEDLDEDEAISAFLYRFSALKEGGHLPQADVRALGEFGLPQPNSNEEAVEVDVDYGYVNKKFFSPSHDEDDDDWWEGSGSDEDIPQATKSEKKNEVTPSPPTGSDNNENSPNEADFAKSESEVEAVDLTEVDEEVIFGPNEEARKVELAKAKVEVVAPKRNGRGRFNKKKQLSVDTEAMGITASSSFIFENGEDRGVWLRKNAMANYASGWDRHRSWLSPRSSANIVPKPIDGVVAAEKLRKFAFGKRTLPMVRPWRLSYEERTQEHPGYLRVDVHSLRESASVDADSHELDHTPWEHRIVLQRFLHERSIGLSRNWFGNAQEASGNDKLEEPVCQPKSMEMPIENIPDPGEWTEEWFTTWKAPDNGNSRPGGSLSQSYHDSHSEDSDEESTSDSESMSSSGSCSSGSTDDDAESDEGSWEEAPECGTIVNVEQKIGERVTRVHPDYTSSLRRSRWRRKYFPKGSFPY